MGRLMIVNAQMSGETASDRVLEQVVGMREWMDNVKNTKGAKNATVL